MGREEWISVLKLSTLWEFKDLRKEALDKLSRIEIDAVDKVMLARVERWLAEGYMQLVKRNGGISSEEAKKLGYETTFQLYERREDAFRRSLAHLGQADFRIFDDLEANIHKTFREELTDVRHDGDVTWEARRAKQRARLRMLQF
jgi:hypothetical protein